MNKRFITTLLASTFTLLSLTSFISVPFNSVQAEENSFKDVPSNHWAYAALEKLIEEYEIDLGYPDGTFQGNRTVTRYEMAALLVKLLDAMEEPEIDPKDLESLKELIAEFKEEVQALRNDIENRIGSLEKKLEETQAQNDEWSELFKQFSKNVMLSGNLGFRYQLVTPNLTDFSKATSNTPQVRVALGAYSRNPNDVLSYGLGLMVGNQTIPVLTWPNLGQFFNRLELNLDEIYLRYKPIDMLSFTLGKFPNTLANSELFLDFDIKPQGLMESFTVKNIAPWFTQFDLMAGQTVLNMSKDQNTFLLSGKAGTTFNFGNFMLLDFRAAYHHYLGEDGIAKAIDATPAQLAGAAPSQNTKDSTGFLANFGILNGFARLTFPLSESFPLSFSADYLYNLATASKNQGFQLSAQLGRALKPGEIYLGYNFKRLEADSVISVFVEDQMGSTDTQAHEGFFGVKIAPDTLLRLTFQSKTAITTPGDPVFTFRTFLL